MDEKPNSYYRTLMDAVPLSIFVVDEDVRIQDVNRAAVATFGMAGDGFRNRRGGDLLHCLHALDGPRGCGSGPHCRNCVIRSSVAETFQGQHVNRRRMKLELLKDASRKQFEMLITTCPIPEEPGLALVILEDISEVTMLHDIIPICAKCKKIRDDQQFWRKVESYFHEHLGVDFSHGLCPTCASELSQDL